MRLLIAMSVGLLIGGASAGAQRPPASDSPLSFSCATFPAGLSEADLRLRFGDRNVATAPVPWGGAEGDYNEGTVVFGDTPDARVEILWHDRGGKRVPEWISVRGTKSRWQTTGGITLGTDLRTIEKLNHGPFRLIGLANDVQGTVMSWVGGQLESQDRKDCRVRMRLRSENPTSGARAGMMQQVAGDREFSSGHPAMQAIDPAIYELLMAYTQGRLTRQ